ncbi:YueH family protein [Staphylococcus epidermidis]|uniref:YueH family protein n=1 Tax=Staphylococcus epidermidis TaxID=1282 RepID=UPI0011A77C63|nr:YueH family protein [Staphylococcus epidermidis]MCG1063053.1 YueH family protein [Staphylococcus epidermidis]MCG1067453.1 YueH family protein [Staphylococcus epidermidis]MCG1103658.1 YueH family protein [Staphylococcus epidermidis]MCG1993468.1 YueH family protein [Staphylococcus epidermidis]MCG2017656.1 YueH family protein [Staphylococcus epidermidis]
MKIKSLQFHGMMINVYYHQSNDSIMLAIPELFWSIELSKELDTDKLYEELVMQLFNLLTEVEADTLARNITDLIRNESKGE